MKADIKQRWIDALRSGKYEQGRGALRTGDTFCCLGVLCDIHKPEGWKFCQGGGDVARQWGYEDFNGDGERNDVLPPHVKRWAGLELQSPEIKKLDGYAASLANLNDNGTTFAEIADLIETHL